MQRKIAQSALHRLDIQLKRKGIGRCIRRSPLEFELILTLQVFRFSWRSQIGETSRKKRNYRGFSILVSQVALDADCLRWSIVQHKLIPKTIGNRKKKRLCLRLRSGDKHHLRKSADRKAQISPVSGTNAFLICAFRSADFLRWCLSPERNLRHNLFFLFTIVFGINLIHFFDEKKDGADEIRSFFFRCFDPLSRHLTEVKRSRRVRIYEECELSRVEECNFLATKSVNSAPFHRGETKVQIFGKEKCKTLRQFQRFGKEKCKLLHQFQRY